MELEICPKTLPNFWWKTQRKIFPFHPMLVHGVSSYLATSKLATKERSRHQVKSSRHHYSFICSLPNGSIFLVWVNQWYPHSNNIWRLRKLSSLQTFNHLILMGKYQFADFADFVREKVDLEKYIATHQNRLNHLRQNGKILCNKYIICNTNSNVRHLGLLNHCIVAPGGGGTPLKKWRGCSSYLLGGKICEVVPLRVLKLKMIPDRIVTVPFKGLQGHQSDKIMKAVTLFVKKITFTSQFVAWKRSGHWQLNFYFRMAPLRGVNEFEASPTKWDFGTF